MGSGRGLEQPGRVLALRCGAQASPWSSRDHRDWLRPRTQTSVSPQPFPQEAPPPEP